MEPTRHQKLIPAGAGDKRCADVFSLPRRRSAFLFLLFLAVAWVVFDAAPARAGAFTLGTTLLVEGPAAGSDSVMLSSHSPKATWTAKTNAVWLHLAVPSGIGGTNFVFRFDANPGKTRTGVIIVGGVKLTVIQAGSSYVAASPPTTLVTSGLLAPAGVAVGPKGVIYIADSGNSALKKWSPTNNGTATLVTTSGLHGRLSSPIGLAVDASGNVYIADSGNNAIEKWTASKKTVTALVSNGLAQPFGVAVANSTTLFIADTGDNALKEWLPVNKKPALVTVVSNGLANPEMLAVDIATNVYIADTGDSAIRKWGLAGTNRAVSTVVSNVSVPRGVAVDGSGNVYLADAGDGTIQKWTAANNTVTMLLSSSTMQPFGVAVDESGNVYFTDSLSNTLRELPRAFVNPASHVESTNAGTDSLPEVLPVTENLAGPFAPVSDQPWLTITKVAKGVVKFAFTATKTNRTGHITLLGQAIPILQGSGIVPAFAIGTTNLIEGPGVGSDSVVLAANTPWTASSQSTWLHLSAGYQDGKGNTNFIFSYDANSGTTRTGTLTIAGLTLTVTQAGSTYVRALAPVTTVVGSGLRAPTGVAVGPRGNVYIADNENNAIRKWTATNNAMASVITNGLTSPVNMAVDAAGNVYVANTYGNSILKWTAANNTVTPLVASGLNGPFGVAVDTAGNVYIADTLNNAVKEWMVASNAVTTLVSNKVFHPFGVAVDVAGNVYIADFGSNAIREWTGVSNALVTVTTNGLSSPAGLAVDGSGNVYIADAGNNAIKKWSAVDKTVTTLISTGLSYPYSVAVDGVGNLYVADTLNNAVKELPRAFIDPTPRTEGAAAGSDTLPPMLPITENVFTPFAPVSDQPWLAIAGITNGAVTFSFSASPGTNRAANITLLGQTIPIMQNGAITPPTLVGAGMPVSGMFQFAFSNSQGATFTVLTSTNLSLPLANWTVAGTPTLMDSGVFQFTAPISTNDTQRFYRVSSP